MTQSRFAVSEDLDHHAELTQYPHYFKKLGFDVSKDIQDEWKFEKASFLDTFQTYDDELSRTTGQIKTIEAPRATQEDPIVRMSGFLVDSERFENWWRNNISSERIPQIQVINKRYEYIYLYREDLTNLEAALAKKEEAINKAREQNNQQIYSKTDFLPILEDAIFHEANRLEKREKRLWPFTLGCSDKKKDIINSYKRAKEEYKYESEIE